MTCIKISVGIHEGKTPLAKSRCRWEDYTEMSLQETGFEAVDWIQLAQDEVQCQCQSAVKVTVNLQIP